MISCVMVKRRLSFIATILDDSFVEFLVYLSFKSQQINNSVDPNIFLRINIFISDRKKHKIDKNKQIVVDLQMVILLNHFEN